MRILLTGASGQVGSCLVASAAKGRLPPGWILTALNRQQLDITEAEAVNAAFRRLKPNVVINAAAWTDVDAAERDVDRAMAVNALGAANVAAAATQHGARMLHISTDYVFDGSARQPIDETVRPKPLNVYGASKLAGELAVQREAPDAVILRTSWLYSAFGTNFLKAVLHRGAHERRLDVVNDQTGCPTSADDLAQAIVDVTQHADLDPGLYHYCGKDPMTWLEFARMIVDAAARHNSAWKGVKLSPVASSAYEGSALRPTYSVLSCEKIKATGVGLHGPQDHLDQLVTAILAS